MEPDEIYSLWLVGALPPEEFMELGKKMESIIGGGIKLHAFDPRLELRYPDGDIIKLDVRVACGILENIK